MTNVHQPIRSGRKLPLLTAALCLAMLGSSPAWASQASIDVAAHSSESVNQLVAQQTWDTGEVPILRVRDKSDQLDVGDERPIGDQGVMRGKKDLFGKRRVEGLPDNSMLDLGIWVCGGLLLVLIIFAFAYRPAPKAPQSNY